MLPVSAGSIAIARMTLPPRGWRCRPWPIQSSDGPRPYGARDVLDQLAGTPVCCLAPGRRAGVEQRLELVVAEHVLGDERLVDEAVAADHVREREGERGVAAGPELEVGVGRSPPSACGSGRSRSPGRGASRSQWSCCVRRARRGVRAPHDDAGRRRRGLGIEALLARAVDVAERDVAGVVADGVRLHLGRAEAVEEALREGRVDQRAGARVVRVEDARARRARRRSRAAARRSPAIASAQLDRLEAPPRPSARRAAAASSAAARDRGTRRCSRSSTCGRACRARRDDRDRRARA